MNQPDKLRVDKPVPNPDTELHLGEEKDTLYNDGLEVEEDTESLADTHGEVKRG